MMSDSKIVVSAIFVASQHVYDTELLDEVTSKLPVVLFFDNAPEAERVYKLFNTLPGVKAVYENRE